MLRHAFMMSVHTNLEQLQLLVTALNFGDIYIHVDKKNDDLFNSLKKLYNNSQNIFFVENRISVNWSGFSQVQATIELMKLIKGSNNEYDYVHFISGQDLPLMNHQQMDNYILSKGLNKQFIEVHDIGNYKWRLLQYSFFRENPNNRKKVYRVIDVFTRFIQMPFVRRKNFRKYDLYKGSQWLSITYDCLEWVLDKIENTDYCDKFIYTACSDEHFFQILLMNSSYRKDILGYNSRYIVFEGMNASPKTLTMQDSAMFMNGEYMFARKFDMQKDKEVIDYISKKLGG